MKEIEFEDINSNVNRLDELAALFHDCPMKWLTIKGEKLCFTIKLKENEVTVEIFPVNKITQKDKDGDKNDWFLTFDLDKDKSILSVDGVLNKYEVLYNKKTKVKVNKII